jgi:hypothetical protein
MLTTIMYLTINTTITGITRITIAITTASHTPIASTYSPFPQLRSYPTAS